jgi:serine/threonine protein kinase
MVEQRLVAGRYRLHESLGSGGMGRVWLARDEVLRRDVAVKEVLLPEGLTDAEREELCVRTMREAQAAARLSHPNVVQIYDVVEEQERPWIVMEYVKSRSLYQTIKEDGRMGPKRAAEIGLAVLAALRAAHTAGVLHRDVKPGNVLLAKDGRVVLTDFGLATFTGGEGAVTRPGLILGSVQYVAPERARDGTSSPESDLWALGATLYAAVEGRSPYARSTSMATLTALATQPPDPPLHAGPLRPVLIGLLRRNPRARMTAREVERYLARIANLDARSRLRLGPRHRPVRAALPPPAGDGKPPAGDGKPPAATGPAIGTAADPVTSNALTVKLSSGAARTRSDRETLAAPSRSGRSVRWLLVVIATLLVALGTTAAALLRNQPKVIVTGTPSGSASAPVSPCRGLPLSPAGPHPVARPSLARVTGPPPRGGTDAFSVPPGFIPYVDGSGFSVGVPVNLPKVPNNGSVVCFALAGQLLGIDQWHGPDQDPVAYLRFQDRRLAAQLAGYTRKGIQRVTGRQGEVCAELEFLYQGEGVRNRVRLHAERAPTGMFYLLIWQDSEFDWSLYESRMGVTNLLFAPAWPTRGRSPTAGPTTTPPGTASPSTASPPATR